MADQRRTVHWIARGLAAVLVACVIGLFIVFTRLREPVGTPEKPSKIPESAIWYPGEKGGTWIQLMESREKDFRLRVYKDFSGELLVDTWFALSPNCQELHFAAPEFHRVVRGYDGNVVWLTTKEGRQDCQLKPVFPTAGISGSRLVYEVEGKEVSAEIFKTVKDSLEFSREFTDGEAVQPGKRPKDPHKTGTVHMQDAKDRKSGKRYQLSISSFDDRTVYSISRIKRAQLRGRRPKQSQDGGEVNK